MKRLLVVMALVTGALAYGVPAEASFPGTNGRIVFQTDRDGNGEIYSMNPDGSNLVNLTNDPGYDATPAWSPDGTRIAFTKNYEIWAMNADGSAPLQLTHGTAFAFPAWSPDGQWVAYLGGDDDIHVVDAFGAFNDTNITKSPEWERPPSWSPDGTRIAFGRYDPTAGIPDDDIWLMDPDGSNQVQITSSPGFDGLPDWSPDSTKIVFCAAGVEDLDLFTIDPDGSNRLNLTSSSGRGECAPHWSPDGGRIAYHDYGPGPAYNLDIFVMQANGTGATGLASHTADDRWPSWQPLSAPVPVASNDDIDAATPISALPFSDGPWDTTGATTDTDPPDPGCSGSAGPSVWYALTLPADTPLEVNTQGSSYDTTLSVYTRSKKGALTQLSCNDDFYDLQSRLRFQARGGTTYLIMVGAYDGGPGGTLHLNAYEVFEVGLTLTGGTVDAPTGVATVTGVVMCSQDAWVDSVNGTLRQRIGRARLEAGFWVGGFQCTAPGTAWSAPASSPNGLFVGGNATLLNISTYACTAASECDDERVSGPVSIRLRGR